MNEGLSRHSDARAYSSYIAARENGRTIFKNNRYGDDAVPLFIIYIYHITLESLY